MRTHSHNSQTSHSSHGLAQGAEPAADLFNPAWALDDLTAGDFGPYPAPLVSDAEKEEVWAAYRAGRPTRVPVTLAMTPLVALLDRRIHCGGQTYQQDFADPASMLRSKLLRNYVCCKRYHLAAFYAAALAFGRYE